MTGQKKKLTKIRIVDDEQLDNMVDNILTMINKSDITFYDAFGLIEIVKMELIRTYLYDDET